MADPIPPAPDTSGTSNELIFADTQVPHLEYPEIRLQALNGFNLPSERLPGSKLGITAVVQEGILEYQKKLLAANHGVSLGNLKLRFLGDLGDTGAKPEPMILEDEHRHLEEAGVHTDLQSLVLGNHDAFPNGTFNSKMAFGFLQFLLNLESNDRDFINNIAAREAGGKDNLLDKKAYLEFVHSFLKIKWDPVPVAESSKYTYQLKGAAREYRWNRDSLPELKQTFGNFWKKGADGWSTLVEYGPNADEKTERNLLFLTAHQITEQKTSVGLVPVYAITVDAIDFLTMSSRDGAIFGHLSYLQTRLVQSFIAEMKSRNPNARFILESHYSMDNIEEPGIRLTTLLSPSKWFAPSSDFHEVLEDESVIALVAGHSHKWGYMDLNSEENREELGIEGRKTPLYQYKVTSMIDNPIGVAWRRISNDGDNLYLSFDKIPLHWQDMYDKAPALVQEEFNKLKPHVNTYVPAWQIIPGDKYKFQAHPEADTADKLPVMLDYNQGTAFEPGRFLDQLKAKDGNLLMAEQAEATLREYMAIIRLELHESGFGDAVDEVDKVFQSHFDNMDDYFVNAIGSSLSQDPTCQKKLATLSLDRYAVDFARTLNTLSLALEDKLGKEANEGYAKTISEMSYQEYRAKLEKMPRKEKIQAMIHLIYLLENYYRDWIRRYTNAMFIRHASGHKEADFLYELGNHNDLLATKEWFRMDQTIRALGVNTPSRLFRAMTSAYAGEQRSLYLRDVSSSDAPEKVTIKINLKTHKVEATTPIEISDEELAKRQKNLPRPEGMDPKELDDIKKRIEHDWKRWEDHWVLSLGSRGEFDGWLHSWPTSLALSGGKQVNFWPAKMSLWRITGKATADVHTAGPNGFETGGTLGLYADVAGILALGAAGTAGWSFGDLTKQGDGLFYNGVGGRLNIFENWAEFGVTRSWYRDLDKNKSTGVTQYDLMFDIPAILRGSNLVDRDF